MSSLFEPCHHPPYPVQLQTISNFEQLLSIIISPNDWLPSNPHPVGHMALLLKVKIVTFNILDPEKPLVEKDSLDNLRKKIEDAQKQSGQKMFIFVRRDGINC